jgi:hypothetical protein
LLIVLVVEVFAAAVSAARASTLHHRREDEGLPEVGGVSSRAFDDGAELAAGPPGSGASVALEGSSIPALNFFQQVGQRHSRIRLPFGTVRRNTLHPCTELMRE